MGWSRCHRAATTAAAVSVTAATATHAQSVDAAFAASAAAIAFAAARSSSVLAVATAALLGLLQGDPRRVFAAGSRWSLLRLAENGPKVAIHDRQIRTSFSALNYYDDWSFHDSFEFLKREIFWALSVRFIVDVFLTGFLFPVSSVGFTSPLLSLHIFLTHFIFVS